MWAPMGRTGVPDDKQKEQAAEIKSAVEEMRHAILGEPQKRKKALDELVKKSGIKSLSKESVQAAMKNAQETLSPELLKEFQERTETLMRGESDPAKEDHKEPKAKTKTRTRPTKKELEAEVATVHRDVVRRGR